MTSDTAYFENESGCHATVIFAYNVLAQSNFKNT